MTASFGNERYRCELTVREDRKSRSPISRFVEIAAGQVADLALLRGELCEPAGFDGGDADAACSQLSSGALTDDLACRHRNDSSAVISMGFASLIWRR